MERHEKLIEKLETENINQIKKLKEIETKKKELEELETEKTNETTAIIPKEVRLPYFSRYVFQLINQAREKKVFEKCIRITNILKDLIMKKK